jgi:hypothetical protein
MPAVKELEVRGFLTPLPEHERFLKVQQGNWKAVFVKATKRLAAIPQEGDDALVKELVARGITPRSAQKLVSQHERSRVEANLRLFDATRSRGGEGGIRSRAGWLYSAIVTDYAANNEDPVSSPGHSDPVHPPSSHPRRAVVSPAQEVAEVATPASTAFEKMWAGLSADERHAFEAEAVACAPAFLQRQYHEGKEAHGTLWRVTRERILIAHHERRHAEEATSCPIGT